MVNERPRVLLLSGLPPPAGGVGFWTQSLLASQLAVDFDIHLIDRSVKRLDGPGFELHRTMLGLRSIEGAVRYMHARRPAVVHANTTGTPLALLRDIPVLTAARSLGVRTVLHVHGSAARFHVRPALTPLLRRALRRVDVVLVLSEESQTQARRLGLNNVVRLPNGVRLPPQRGERETAMTSSELRVVYVGWIKRAKGVIELLKAASLVPEVHLTLVGPYADEGGVNCKEEVDSLCATSALAGRVQLVGEVSRDEVWGYLGDADLFVLPSYSEGFPLSMLEAMAAGLPCVVTNVGAMPEAIRDHENGFVVPAADSAALATALSHYVQHPADARRHGEAARELVASTYSVDVLMARLGEIWRPA